ncbi:hypothetical protein ACHMW6_32445 [Pseudoduganella sp. UC29_106]|uniref:hypothetical protein n=1 Tax=Pseudoduganella sp. UC29_106 TaxID=3374553 RepID=UPI003756E6E9
MADTVDTLVLDLLEWLGSEGKPYAEVMEVWRTSCPRMPVWEEANSRGLVQRTHTPGAGTLVTLSPAGRRFLDGASAARRADH